jgi:hypothetical protein
MSAGPADADVPLSGKEAERARGIVARQRDQPFKAEPFLPNPVQQGEQDGPRSRKSRAGGPDVLLFIHKLFFHTG